MILDFPCIANEKLGTNFSIDFGCAAIYYSQLPAHQNSLTAARAIPLFCLSPGTAQRQRNGISNFQIFVRSRRDPKEKLPVWVPTLVYRSIKVCQECKPWFRVVRSRPQSNYWYRGPTELVPHFAYRGSLHRHMGAARHIIDMVWLCRSPIPAGYFTFSNDFSCIATLRGRWWGQYPVIQSCERRSITGPRSLLLLLLKNE